MCRAFRDPTCYLPSHLNQDFRRLTRNQWTKTCRCDQAGLNHSLTLGQCVDADECSDSLDFTGPSHANLCPEPNQVCQNTLAGYRCVCRLGFSNVSAKGCQRIEVNIRPVTERTVTSSAVSVQSLAAFYVYFGQVFVRFYRYNYAC